jgi:glycosyltransferase involved in cell wall biosynthesis
MNTPLVSIVIPTFNQARYLSACIDHCHFQTWENLELIIVDGGSNDETKALLERLHERMATHEASPVIRYDETRGLVRKHCRTYLEDTYAVHPERDVKIVTFEKDIGRTATYNAGFAEARGTYCTYVVGDDLSHPHMMEELVAVLEETGADLAYLMEWPRPSIRGMPQGTNQPLKEAIP